MIIVEMSYQEFLSSDSKNSLNNSINVKTKAETSPKVDQILLVKVAETSTGIGTYLVKWP